MSFDSIVGQDRAVAALRTALRTGQVAHAYLFAGHPGIGKMTAAEEFARALVCRKGGDEACGACPACGKAARGTHPDIHRIKPEGKGRVIKIEVFRDRDTGEGLIRDMSFKPNEAAYRVVLIDDAHAMTREAANCLLKTLEEPPPESVLVLVTPRPDELPETIVSRCQLIRFALLSPEQIREQLEAKGVAPEAARFLAQSAGGSLGRALALATDRDLPELRRNVLALLTSVTASNTVRSAAAFVALVRGSVAPRQESPDSPAEPGTRAELRTMAERLFDLAILFYRDVAVRQLDAPGARRSSADLAELIDREAAISRLGIRSILDTIEEAKARLRSNVDLDAVALDAFSSIAGCRAGKAA